MDIPKATLVGMVSIDEDEIQRTIFDELRGVRRVTAYDPDAFRIMFGDEIPKCLVVPLMIPAFIGFGMLNAVTRSNRRPLIDRDHLHIGHMTAEIRGELAGADAKLCSLAVSVNKAKAGDNFPSPDFAPRTNEPSHSGPFLDPL